jgi:hypothetical protein
MDLLNGYSAIGYQIDTLWNIFMIVHLTLFAGLWKIDEHKKIGKTEWTGLLIGYLAFAYLNWNALRSDYTILDHIAQDIISNISNNLSPYSNLQRALIKQRLSHREFIVAVIHIFAGIFIITYGLYLSYGRRLPLTWQAVSELWNPKKETWQ